MRWDAGMYDAAHSPQTDVGRELIDMARVKADDSILDIGCGTGTLTIELARLAQKGKVVGIDPSAEMLERAREKALSAGNMALINIPAQKMGFKEEFDLIYSNSALQWIKEQEDVTARAYATLKHKGRVAIQMPARDFCWELMENIHGAISALGLEAKYKKMESPWRFPVKEEFAGFLKDAGFASINVFYKDYALLFKGIEEVLDWGVSAALRPYLARLDGKKQERFKYAFAMGFENYRTEKGIEFNFRRLFAFGEKK